MMKIKSMLMERKTIRMKAFTLIELMIVVAIIGIITAIAYPAYDEQVTKAKRADAMAALMSASQSYERYRANNFDYNVALATIFSAQVPVDGGTAYYTLSNTAPATGSYTLLATPIGSMAGKNALTLTNTGARTWGAYACWPESASSCP